MILQESYINLTNLRFHAYHGVMPQERIVGNDYTVSLRICFDMSRAMQSDEVNDTINYATAYKLVQEEMTMPCNLLEHVAARIAENIIKRFPEIKALEIRLTKLNPPMGADCDGASVELHLINDKTIR